MIQESKIIEAKIGKYAKKKLFKIPKKKSNVAYTRNMQKINVQLIFNSWKN